MSSATRVADGGVTKTASSPHCKLRSVDLSAVRWADGFWADRFTQCAEASLPCLYDLAADPAKGHVIENLRIAAGRATGEFAGTHWQDAWAYKWLEAAASVYGVTRDESLARRIDDLVDLITAAQQPDGYLATQVTVRGWQRYQRSQIHELYTMGHLLTAAAVHHRVTGKTSFLDVARRVADHMCEAFRDELVPHTAHNPSAIMGLVELYRTTGEPRYLEAARAIVDSRGASSPAVAARSDGIMGTDTMQDRVPLRQETQAVGHGVFATYLYAGAADLVAETGERELFAALDRIWRDLTETKMYITGGCDAMHTGFSIRRTPEGKLLPRDKVHEAIGTSYELPNATTLTYNETCTQVGAFMWAWRMLQLTGEVKYADVMELQMYNGWLSGVGLDGTSWFYINPLRWHGREQEVLQHNGMHLRNQPGMRQVCCPTNVLRSIAEMHGYVYCASDGALWVNHYGASVLDDGEVRLVQQTGYPWDGRVRITLERVPQRSRSLMLRVPGWADGATIAVNGEPADADARPGRYAALRRAWSPGDVVELGLPLRVRLMRAHPKVEEVRNQVAAVRGPLVYCLESPDLPEGVDVAEVHLPRDAVLTPRHDPGLLGGVTVLEGTARRVPEGDWAGALYRECGGDGVTDLPVRLIPYYAWANRGISKMSVWLPVW